MRRWIERFFMTPWGDFDLEGVMIVTFWATCMVLIVIAVSQVGTFGCAAQTDTRLAASADLDTRAKIIGDDPINTSTQAIEHGSGNRQTTYQGPTDTWSGWWRYMLTGGLSFGAAWVLPSCWPLRRSAQRVRGAT